MKLSLSDIPKNELDEFIRLSWMALMEYGILIEAGSELRYSQNAV
jgi:hypothetical protein